jgi:hypothetical protein
MIKRQRLIIVIKLLIHIEKLMIFLFSAAFSMIFADSSSHIHKLDFSTDRKEQASGREGSSL